MLRKPSPVLIDTELNTGTYFSKGGYMIFEKKYRLVLVITNALNGFFIVTGFDMYLPFIIFENTRALALIPLVFCIVWLIKNRNSIRAMMDVPTNNKSFWVSINANPWVLIIGFSIIAVFIILTSIDIST